MCNIIFKGKTPSGIWVYGSLIYTGKFCCILEHEDSDRYDYPYLDSDLGTIDGQAIPVEPTTVCQYTGLNDKHGNKIFKGDIVKNEYGRYEQVRYIYGRYYPFNAYPEYKCWNPENCEVVGNIHDNPELLKGEDR